MRRTGRSAGERSGIDESLARRRLLLAGGAGAALLAGCVGADGEQAPDDSSNDDDDAETGTFRLLISDQPVAIDEFDSLEVTLDRARVFRGDGEDDDAADDDDDEPDDEGSEGGDGDDASGSDDDAPDDEEETQEDDQDSDEEDDGETDEPDDSDDESDARDDGFLELDLEGATVDLTEVIGEKAVPVIEARLEAGRYSKIELHAADVDGIVGGESVDVKIPSEKLQIVKPFEVAPDESLSFVFDINVVKRGQQGGYNLLPVISESGVAGKDVDVEEIDPDADDDDGDDRDDAEPDDSEADAADTDDSNNRNESRSGGPGDTGPPANS